MWNKTLCHKRPCRSRLCKNTGIDSVFAFLYNNVDQGKLSQASMPLATMLRTLVFTAFLFLYVWEVADSGLSHSMSEIETQGNKK